MDVRNRRGYHEAMLSYVVNNTAKNVINYRDNYVYFDMERNMLVVQWWTNCISNKYVRIDWAVFASIVIYLCSTCIFHFISVLNSWANWTNSDLWKTSVWIRILIDWTWPIWLVIQPCHASRISWTSPKRERENHALSKTSRHSGRNSSLSIGLTEVITIVIWDGIESIKLQIQN